MKKIKYLLTMFITCVLLTTSVKAAPAYSLSVSSSTVENGKKVTAYVKISNAASWDIQIISSGNTSGCSNRFIDYPGTNQTKTFSTTCTATSLGSITFTIKGDITSEDGTNIEIKNQQPKKVSVVEPRPASQVNTLKSLSVEGYDFNEKFDEEKLEYSLTVPSTVDKIKINASKKDSYSRVEGDGKKEVFEGANKFEINVTSESGSIRTYVVTVNVEDQNPIKVTVDNIDYTVIKTSKNLEIPEGYEETTIKINDVDVPAFVNETTSITLIALKDMSGNVVFHEYSDGNYKKYIELKTNSNVLLPLNINSDVYKNWKQVDIKIDNNTVKALQYKNQETYYIIYAMDLNNGEKSYYLYDSKNNTYQVFNDELYKDLISDNNFYLYMLLGASGLIFLCIIIIIALLNRKPKIKKNVPEEKIQKKKVTKEEILSENTTRLDTFDDIKTTDMKKKRNK